MYAITGITGKVGGELARTLLAAGQRVQNGKITEHWGVGNLLSLMQQIGGWTPSASNAISRDA